SQVQNDSRYLPCGRVQNDAAPTVGSPYNVTFGQTGTVYNTLTNCTFGTAPTPTSGPTPTPGGPTPTTPPSSSNNAGISCADNPIILQVGGSATTTVKATNALMN